MRRLILGIAIGAVGLLGAVTAQAGALTGATFGLSVGTLGPLEFVGSGTAAGTALSSTSASVAAGNAFAGMMTTVLTAKQAPPLSAIVVNITANEKIEVKGDPLLGDGAVGAIKGVANQKAFMNTLIAVPIAAGISGTENIKGSVFQIKAVSKKWTSGNTTVTGLGSSMMATGTFMTMGSVMTGTPGAVTLVAVSKVTVTGAADIITYTVAKLELDFASVPEPAMPLMLAAGAATFALVGGRRLRKR
jgi:hypothetical protein